MSTRRDLSDRQRHLSIVRAEPPPPSWLHASRRADLGLVRQPSVWLPGRGEWMLVIVLGLFDAALIGTIVWQVWPWGRK